ncbi:hypothetical protein Ga0100230_015395 [Opitutaceae bacterium TAV3]|nr:hypothetical protein Ga0100230_015395 [Opitutaceae bacterium TAV3]
MTAVVTALAFASVAVALPTTLLEDSFDDGNRDGWFGNSSTASNYTLDNDADTLTIKSGNHLLTYFDTTTLAIGESLTVSLHLSFNDPVTYSNGFRLALYDSHGTKNRVTSNGHGSTNDLFKPYTGYRADMNFTAYNGTTTAIGIQHRNPADATHTGNSLVHSNTGMYYQSVGTGGLSATPTDGVLYTGTFTLTRLSETGTRISVSIVGTNLTNYACVTDDANGFSTFDTFAIFPSSSSAMTSLTLHDVTITHTAAAVPEPATAAVTLGVFAAALATVILALRRRRH